MTPRNLISCVLGVTAGFVDVICLARYGAFAATQTGNLVFIGRSIASCLFFSGPVRQLLYSVSVLVSNVTGAFCISAVDHYHPGSTARFAAPYLALCTLLGDVTGSWDNWLRIILREPPPKTRNHTLEVDVDADGELHRWHEGELTS